MGLKIDRRAEIITKIVIGIVAAVVVFCMGKIFFWENSYYHSKSVSIRNSEQKIITELTETANPSETKPDEKAMAEHQAASTAPRYLEIPRLEVKSRVKFVNSNEHQFSTPDNIYDLNWYSESSRPGYNGVLLISGLTRGPKKEGAFAHLDNLTNGDNILITRGDGKVFEYEVKDKAIIDREEAAEGLAKAQKRIDNKETLVLIANRRNSAKPGDYNSLVIVSATLK